MLRTCRVVTAWGGRADELILCKQRVVWDHTQLGGSGRGIRASKEKGGQEGEQSEDNVLEPKGRL